MTADLVAAALAACDRRDELSAAATPSLWWTDRAVADDGEVVMADGLRRAHLYDMNPTAAEDAALIVDARNSYDATTAAFRTIIELHVEEIEYDGPGTYCDPCWTTWPCDTVRAVLAALGLENP